MLKKGLGKKNLVGVDIGSSSVKAVELQGKAGSLQLVSLGLENVQPDSIVDGQIMELNDVANVISNIFKEHQIRTDRVAAGVSGHSVIVKNIVVPQMSEEELEESMGGIRRSTFLLTSLTSASLPNHRFITRRPKRADGSLQTRQDRQREAGYTVGREAAGYYRCRRIRPSKLLEINYLTPIRTDCGAAEHWCCNDEHQYS